MGPSFSVSTLSAAVPLLLCVREEKGGLISGLEVLMRSVSQIFLTYVRSRHFQEHAFLPSFLLSFPPAESPQAAGKT